MRNLGMRSGGRRLGFSCVLAGSWTGSWAGASADAASRACAAGCGAGSGACATSGEAWSGSVMIAPDRRCEVGREDDGGSARGGCRHGGKRAEGPLTAPEIGDRGLEIVGIEIGP